jgi:uncharacterized membrane protein YgcG
MTTSRFHRFVLSSAAIAGLWTFAQAADAKPMTCHTRQTNCVERCIMGNQGGKENSCIQRTCNHQFNKCMEESSGGGERGGGGGGRGSAGGGGGGAGSGGSAGKSSGKPIVRDHRGRG